MSDTTELIAELRSEAYRWGPGPTVTGVRMIRAADALEAQQARINAALALHEHVQVAIGASTLGDITYSQGCRYCGSQWPCDTVRALSGGVSDTEQPNQLNRSE